MIVIPAIDIKDGRCVRLRQGKMDSSTVFNENPSEQARQWEGLGASRIHVVDLDGSVGGAPVNVSTIERIVRSVGVPVQLGGGIRDEATIERYLDLGIGTVILGTVAARNPDLVLNFLARFPGKIALGIDARAGRVAVEGWTESTSTTAVELGRRFDYAKPAAFIYTDIERDGMMRGPNIGATKDFADGVSAPVILSGGISRMSDVEEALPLERHGVTGIIIGRALYDGKVKLEEAIRMVEKRDAL